LLDEERELQAVHIVRGSVELRPALRQTPRSKRARRERWKRTKILRDTAGGRMKPRKDDGKHSGAVGVVV
jgi:hypothetical protein